MDNLENSLLVIYHLNYSHDYKFYYLEKMAVSLGRIIGSFDGSVNKNDFI